MKTKLLLFAVLTLFTSVTASADTWTDGNGTTWSYRTDGNNATLCKENPDGTYGLCIEGYIPKDLVIPSWIDEYRVTGIGENAFAGCNSFNSITISGRVTSISSTAFNFCDGLTSIKVERDSRVYDSRNDCNAIIERATNTLILGIQTTEIPNSVTSIGENAFAGCNGLTSITIPSSVTSIGETAFYSCINLTSITIPNSVTSIGEAAFADCSGLKSVQVEEGNSAYDSRNNCNAIIEKATNTLILGTQGTIIPNSVTSIGKFAFYGCSGLASIIIPNSVTSIGEDAFSSCSSLTSINIPNSVTSIGKDAFSSCFSLTSINIPNSVTSISKDAFWGCISLTSVTIPNSVTSIGDGAFKYCSGLSAVFIENETPPSLGGEFCLYRNSIWLHAVCSIIRSF